jgi:hypothetical protein
MAHEERNSVATDHMSTPVASVATMTHLALAAAAALGLLANSEAAAAGQYGRVAPNSS